MTRRGENLVNAARAQSAIHFAIRFADTLQTPSSPLFSRLRMEISPC
jgi:hypothetical protein